MGDNARTVVMGRREGSGDDEELEEDGSGEKKERNGVGLEGRRH